ncbi:MAG: YabP/YqfC family sporulation protein [Clostridia bacterium]|nr:YabP/YqfC family sporulation protein [Clostridia bacterium]
MKTDGGISKCIPAEIAGEAVIQIIGNREITVDGFKGIEEYTDNEVVFHAGSFMLTVCGENLVIKFLSIHTIVIGGNIQEVRFNNS